MSSGRSTREVVKEKISVNLARLKKGGENFEIVIKDPDKALDFKQGKDVDIREIIEIDRIFKDAKKGEVQSETLIKQWLGTEDPLEAAKIILKKGELHLTAEQRKRIFEAKKKKLLEYIHINASDPKTGLPHPIQRIELAMEQAKVHIDPYLPIESQMEKIISQLRSVLPLSFEKARIRILIPAKFAGQGYGNLKSKYNLTNEEWLNDGSVRFEIEVPAGLKPDVYNLVNKLTNGEAIIEEIKKEN